MSVRTLILNKNWVPIDVVTREAVMTLLFRDSAKVVCPESYVTYTISEWIEKSKLEHRTHNVIRTATVNLHRPEVVILSTYHGIPCREVSFTRRNLYRRDNMTCQYCGRRKQAQRLSIDHVTPKSRGGKSTWENCVLACVPCNSKKADKILKTSGMTLLKTPERPKWKPYLENLSMSTMLDSWKKFLPS